MEMIQHLDYKKKLRYALVSAACILLVLLVDHVGFLEGMNHYTYDLFFRIRGPEKPSDKIVVVAIDEATLERFGRWPIPRRHYAALIERLEGAEAIGIDIIMAEPSADDTLLAATIALNGKTFLPVHIDSRRQIVLPSRPLRSVPVGHVHIETGLDGVAREVFHTLVCNGMRLPSFSSVLCGETPKCDYARPAASGPPPRPRIPGAIMQSDPMLINYYGPRETSPYLSLVDILDDKVPADFFKSKIVLVGITATGIDQDHMIPFTQDRNRMPGVEIQAHILNNVISGTPIQPADTWVCRGGVAILFPLCLFLMVCVGGRWAVAAWGAMLSAVCFLSFVLFSFYLFWLPPVSFILAITAALATAYVVNLETMGAKLLLAKKDWETSFHSITDAILIQNKGCETILSNFSAQNLPADFFACHIDHRCQAHSQSGAGKASPAEDDEPVYDSDSNRYFDIKSFPRTDDKCRYNGMVHVIRDVTEQENLQKERQAMEAQLIQSQKMEAIGTLAGGIAHDFNNILAAIMGYTQLASALTPGDGKAQPKLEQVLKACDRAANLVRQILSFSRPANPKKTSFQLGTVVKEVLKLLKATMPATIEIKSNITSKQMVMGDPTQIYQIILNLCTNAAHALDDQPGRIAVTLADITVAAKADAAPGGPGPGPYVRLTVADTGKGIPETIRHRIFEPYFTTKPKGVGTGLGLATVHGIVKNHGGWVILDTHVKEGAVFHVYIPQADAPQTDPNMLAWDKIATGRERLLFVDDQVEVMETGKELLENLGYDVVAKICPERALKTFEGDPGKFDMVITDLSMKKMTGASLAKKLLDIRPDLPIILCTGYNEEITRDKVRDTGVRAFVNKPLLIHELAETIRGVFESDKKRMD